MRNPLWKQSGLVLAATILVAAGTSISSQAQSQNQPPAPAVTRADEMLKAWNQIGNKLIAMAQDFPEDKYDFKVQKDERTFALNLLRRRAGFRPDTQDFRIKPRARLRRGRQSFA